MTIAESFAAEITREAAATRRFLERFEESSADWKPHERSMRLSQLASHIVEMPDWGYSMLDHDHFDFGAADYRPADWKTRAELIENHGRITAGILKRLEGRSDDFLREPWRLLHDGRVLQETTRDRALREYILSHLIHHRGQLSVYYRQCGIAVPGAYGPSADDRAG